MVSNNINGTQKFIFHFNLSLLICWTPSPWFPSVMQKQPQYVTVQDPQKRTMASVDCTIYWIRRPSTKYLQNWNYNQNNLVYYALFILTDCVISIYSFISNGILLSHTVILNLYLDNQSLKPIFRNICWGNNWYQIELITTISLWLYFKWWSFNIFQECPLCSWYHCVQIAL